MDSQRTQQRNRRRERAQRIQAERDIKKSAEVKLNADDSADDESPTRHKPTKPPNRRKKTKEPVYEEDIVDGFAILAFRSYEDLENAVKKHSEKHQARHKKKNHVVTLEDGDTSPVPVKNSKAKSAASATPGANEVLIKNSPQSRFNNHHIISSSLHKSHGPAVPTNTNGNQASYPSPYDSGGGSSTGGEITRINGPAGLTPLKDGLRDDRLSDASSNASSGRGYICDSESEDDKASDTGSDLFTASRKSGELPASPRRSATAPSAAAIPTSSAATNLPPPPTPAPSLPGVISLRVPHRPSRRPLNCLQPASARASPDSPPPRVLSSASPPPSALAAVAAMVTDTAAAAPPGSAAPSYPPLYAPYSSVTVPGTAPSPYLAPSSPGAAASIHRHERLSKSPAPSKSSSGAPSGSPLLPPPAAGSLWTPAISSGSASAASSSANRDTNSTSSLGRPHTPSGDSRDLFGNVSSLSRSASTSASSSSQGPASTTTPSASTSSSGGLLSFSAKSPVVSASIAPPPWGAVNPLQIASSGASSGPSTSSTGPFAPPTSAQQLFPPPLPPPVSSSSGSSTAATATATTSAPNPNPFSAESLFTTSADMLRRELDSRFLASSQDRPPLGPPHFLRAEMHHHQHQHTHVHQHTSPIIPSMMPPPMVSQFKDIPKLPGVDSPFYRQSSLALSAYNSFTPGLLHHGIGGTPFNPPTLTPFAPKIGPDPSKPKPVKTGKWNAMHVRIAWEIHYRQQDKAAEAKSAAIAAGKQLPADLLRPPSGPHHLLGGPLPPPSLNPGSTAFSALQPPGPPHHRPAPFEPPPGSFLSPHMSPFPRFPGFAPPGASPFAGMSPLGGPGVFPGREISPLGPMASPVHEQWNRLHRTAPGFPPPTHGSPWSSLGKSELERREMEERERLKRERERAELERERAEKERAAQQAAAELARKKSQEEKERREREREREMERREREREKKLMLERQQQQMHHHGHHSSHHHRNTAATPPDRKPPSMSHRDRSPLRTPTENGDLKIKEERRAEDEKMAAALMERDRYMYMARQHALPRGLPSPAGTPLPPHPFAAPSWDPYHPHRFDPMAMRFNPLAAHAAAAAMFREREEAAALANQQSLYGPPLMDRKGMPQPPPNSHKLPTPPPSAHHLFSGLSPLLGAPTPPSGKMPSGLLPPRSGPSPKLLPPGPPLPHKLATPPSRLVDMDLHKKESESQSSR
ncbi:autism susceptibility gene 2 protein homolog isoform X2 [Neocloeon triangulifer]|uniref:autism susceptibility gene 2 protein homolog isoform X2 n=1 Tax=Neocloeon triangulifer TaxID=2078957 RepID=UPI00286EE1B2|nr:autism susceptibility gene 2 protein homolog isoform X2 [Neocloeon triangulifer]